MDPSIWIAICERVAKLEVGMIELFKWRDWMIGLLLVLVGGWLASFIKLQAIHRTIKNNGEKKKE